jgi:hypothetical protein
MRLSALLFVTALGATALPATAQSYSENCRQSRAQNQVGGAILGGILGGVLGSNVAASGHRHDGTAVGAVLGGLVGSEVGRGGTRCDTTLYGPSGRSDYPSNAYPATTYPPSSYPSGPYSPYPPSYGGTTAYPPPPPAPYGDYRSYPDDGYADRVYDRDDDRDRDDLYRNGKRSYKRGDDYAGRDCDRAVQITRLPDGTEIRRPVRACRDTYYGDWRIKD